MKVRLAPGALCGVVFFEPYKGGKCYLRKLNELRSAKIYRILATISKWDEAKGELTYMRLRHGAHANIEMNVAVKIVFGEAEAAT